MILVLLGTQKNNFNRLLYELDKCIMNGLVKDEVMVQAGYTHFTSGNMKIIDFIPKQDLNKLIEKADLIITHGGVGSIISCIKMGKKVIAVPRIKKYKEHVNDHQIQIVENFNKNGYIKGIFDIKDLANCIYHISEFKPAKFISNKENILAIVKNYIDNN